MFTGASLAPPSTCSPHPPTLGHAGMQALGSHLRVPVSISVNRGQPCARARRGPELSLSTGAPLRPAEPTQKVLARGMGEAQSCPLRGALLPIGAAKHRLSFTLASSVLSPPSCYFKHANLGRHLSAPSFSEKIKACEPASRSSQLLSGRLRLPALLLPACSRQQPMAVPADELRKRQRGPVHPALGHLALAGG